MYEIGDRVIYQGADKDAYKRVGTLKSIEEKDGKPQLTVEFDDGETFTAPVDDWSREFTNACRNAKFKVGDRVYVSPGKLRGVGGFGVIKGDVGAYDRYWVKFDDEVRAIQLPESVLKSADSWSNASTSTNSVVRNAMAASRRVACNWKRSDAAAKVTHAIDLLVGLYNSSDKMIDIDGPEQQALYTIRDCIDKLKKVAAVFQRERS